MHNAINDKIFSYLNDKFWFSFDMLSRGNNTIRQCCKSRDAAGIVVVELNQQQVIDDKVGVMMMMCRW